jgi:hypothetical protein
MPLEVEVFGEYVIACRNGRCLRLQPNQGIEYYIERLGLINATCDDVGELASILGIPQLVSAYYLPDPVPISAPRSRNSAIRTRMVEWGVKRIEYPDGGETYLFFWYRITHFSKKNESIFIIDNLSDEDRKLIKES